MDNINMMELKRMELIAEWNRAKSFVYPVMRTENKNTDEFDEMPGFMFLNLKVFYKLMYPVGDSMIATAIITNGLLGKWEITQRELHEKAMENLKADRYRICDMFSVCREMFGESVNADMVDWDADMYVMTNQRKMEGAAGMLYVEALCEFANKRGKDFYILPSSIHETILIPFDGEDRAEMLQNMVTEINASQVAEEEQLGNSIYAYSREFGKIYVVLQ